MKFSRIGLIGCVFAMALSLGSAVAAGPGGGGRPAVGGPGGPGRLPGGPEGSGAKEVPVIFLPGYGASAPRAGRVVDFVFHRGVAPEDLRLSVSYDFLVRSLRQAGYREGKSFFGAVYDWRMAVAPEDGTDDGVLERVTAEAITRGPFVFAINYLGYWLDQAVQANPGVEYVDVVTHGAGGVLARAYVQSPAYGTKYKDRRGVTRQLPKIRYLILGACPNEGTAHSWRPWHGDLQDVLGGFLPTTEVEGRFAALAFAYVSGGGTVEGPDHKITREAILGTAKGGEALPDETKFFRMYVPMRQSLMPTNDFLTRWETDDRTNVNEEGELRSEVLLDLNALSTAGSNPWARLVGKTEKDGGVIATFATGAREKTAWKDLVVPGLVNKNPYIQTLNYVNELGPEEGVFLPLLRLLKEAVPTAIPVTESLFPRMGDEEVRMELAGDGNAPFVSYSSTFPGDAEITMVQWGNGAVPADVPPEVAWTETTDYPVYHDVFFYNPEVRSFVVETLTGRSARQEAPTRHEVGPLIDFLKGIDESFSPRDWAKVEDMIKTEAGEFVKKSRSNAGAEQ